MQGAGVPHRVVVTGMGVVTPIGTTVAEFWAGCKRSPARHQPARRLRPGRPEDPDRRPDQGFRSQGAPQALQARQDHPARRPLFLVRGGGGRRGHQAVGPRDAVQGRLSRGLHHRLGRRRPADHGDVLPRPVHPQEARHPPADAAALHRLLGGGPRRHRVRRQGSDVRHLQRLLDGGACHRHRPRLHPPRPGRRRHRRRLRERHQLRRHAGLAGDARAVAGGLLPVRQEAQRHRAGRGRRHPGAGIEGARQGARRQDRWPSCAASA